MLLRSLALVLLLLTHACSLVSKHVATKKHVEDFFWVYALFKLVLAEVLPGVLRRRLVVAWLFSGQIVHPPFFWVSQTCICCAYFFEGVCCLWCMVFVGVKFYSQFFVRFFYVVFFYVLGKAKDFVVIFLFNYFTAHRHLS